MWRGVANLLVFPFGVMHSVLLLQSVSVVVFRWTARHSPGAMEMRYFPLMSVVLSLNVVIGVTTTGAAVVPTVLCVVMWLLSYVMKKLAPLCGCLLLL